MKLHVQRLVEHRSSAQEGLALVMPALVEPGGHHLYVPLPGASSCCGSGCCSSSSCCCSW